MANISRPANEQDLDDNVVGAASIKFHQLVNANIVGIVVWDAGGRIIEANDYYLNTLGYTRQEFEARYINWIEHTPTEYLPIDYQAIRELEEKGSSNTYEKEYIRKDGSRVWVSISAALLPNGKTIAFIRDITERKRDQNALKQSETLYRAISRSIPDSAVWVLDPEMHYVIVEGVLVEKMGFTRQQLEGRTPTDLFGDQIGQALEQRVRRALTGETFRHETPFLGRLIWAQYVPLYDVNEKAIAVMALYQDITEQKRSQEALRLSEEKYRALFNLSRDIRAYCKVVYDDAGQVVDLILEEVNQLAEEIIGRAGFVGECKGHRLSEMSGELGNHFTICQEVMGSGQGRVYEFYASWLDTYYCISVAPLGHEYYLASALDISQMKKSEQELQKSEAALRDYAERLERSNRDLQEFAYIASHDLQEPLRKIESFGMILVKTCAGLTEKQIDYIQRIQKAAVRMRKLVDDLLALSRVDHLSIDFVCVDLTTTLEETLTVLEAQIRRTGGQVAVEELPEIKADPLQMQQLFQNLIGNALKFHRQGVPPKVKVYCGQKTQAIVKIIVEDNGIGFPEAEVERIFQPFQRLVRQTEYEGTGIGLSICRKIVERHHGNIQVRSQPNQGSTFTVTLPVRASCSDKSK